MNARIIRLLGSILIGLALALVILILPVSSAPNTRYHINVTITADEYNIGLDTNCSLREAVKSANDSADFGGCTLEFSSIDFGPTTILLPSGTYTLTRAGANEDLDATGDLDLRQNVIISATGVTPPIVTGNTGWADRLFHILTGTATINGINISGGSVANNGGGGVWIEAGAGLIMNNVTLGGNVASSGGGMVNNGAVTLTNVTLNDNIANISDGGGIYNSGTAALTNVTFSGNSSRQIGGGIYNGYSSGRMTLVKVILSANETSDQGGGIANDGALLLAEVTLNGNHARDGGGIANYGTVTLINSTLSSNTAISSGGGLSNHFGAVTLTNVTLSANNSSLGSGGSIANNRGIVTLTNATLSGNNASQGGGLWQSSTVATQTIYLENTIIANGTLGANCSIGGGSVPIVSNGYNLSSDGTCTLYLNQTSDLNATNPNLGPLANNGGPTRTHLPQPPSLAIDAIPSGINGCGTTLITDQRGALRPINGKCDIGAVEYGWLYLYMWLPLIWR